MQFTNKQLKELIDYWRDGGLHDWKTAKSLWESKRYDACLFFCHLSLEKLLKGLVVIKTKNTAPYTHDLVLLVKRSEIKADEAKIDQIGAFTNFNMKTRYPEDKLAFYKLCNRKFSEPYFKEAKTLITWLKQFYQKNK